MMNSERSDKKETNVTEEGKKIGIDEAIKHNEVINNSLKSQIQNNVILLFKVQKEYRKYKPKNFKN